MAGPYTRSFVAQQHEDVMDKVTAVLTLVGVAKALWPWGKQVAEATVRRLAGEKGIDPEEVFAQVDWN